jgi:hypothetical protein
MKQVIRTYANKIEGQPGQLLGKVLPEYELINTVSYKTDMTDFEAMAGEIKQRFPDDFLGIEKGAVKMDLGRAWGIHSYQLISLEEV